jgi:hypothetical protein
MKRRATNNSTRMPRRRKHRTELAYSAGETSSADYTDFVFSLGEEVNGPIAEVRSEGLTETGMVATRTGKGRCGVKMKPATAKRQMTTSGTSQDAISSRGGKNALTACWEAFSEVDVPEVLTPPAGIGEVVCGMRVTEESQSAEGPYWGALE